MPILKKFVINLERRSDRRQFFLDNNPFDFEFFSAVDALDLDEEYLKRVGSAPDRDFRDPFKGRYVTWAEVACFLSHHALWAKCVELKSPIMILEDDAYLIGDLDEHLILATMSGCDLLYLQRNENEPTKVVDLGDGFERPFYPYNTTAYCITSAGAEKLLTSNILQKIIPVDEFLSRQIQADSLIATA
jgi:GR25 family glycosyltransferase involved in LPS biosynthesis